MILFSVFQNSSFSITAAMQLNSHFFLWLSEPVIRKLRTLSSTIITLAFWFTLVSNEQLGLTEQGIIYLFFLPMKSNSPFLHPGNGGVTPYG